MKLQNKIFGIGLSRTGTSSLNEALSLLGIRSVHWPLSMREINNHQAATDITVTCRYKILDNLFPSSKFIMTIRDKEVWLNSITKHYKDINYLKWIGIEQTKFAEEADIILYGKTKPDYVDFEIAHDRHNKDVLSYFSGRQQDLLIMNITANDEWEPLCKFLNLEIPKLVFPHKNKCFS